MGTNVGHQQFWLAGSRVYFQRDPLPPLSGAGASVEQPIMDLGRIESVSPSIEPQMITLDDADGGTNRRVAEELAGMTETWEVRFSNMNGDMQALLFHARPPTAFTQSATPIGPLAHWAIPGNLVKLRDATGVLMYGITAVTTVTSGATPMVEGTDWEVVSLERGLIRVKSSSIVHVAAGNINITYTPRAITGLRLLNPQQVGTVQGTAMLVWGRKRNTFQTVRECRLSLTSGGAALGVDAFGLGTLRCTVLNDPTSLTPAGRVINWLGDLPSIS